MTVYVYTWLIYSKMQRKQSVSRVIWLVVSNMKHCIRQAMIVARANRIFSVHYVTSFIHLSRWCYKWWQIQILVSGGQENINMIWRDVGSDQSIFVCLWILQNNIWKHYFCIHSTRYLLLYLLHLLHLVTCLVLSHASIHLNLMHCHTNHNDMRTARNAKKMARKKATAA